MLIRTDSLTFFHGLIFFQIYCSLIRSNTVSDVQEICKFLHDVYESFVSNKCCSSPQVSQIRYQLVSCIYQRGKLVTFDMFIEVSSLMSLITLTNDNMCSFFRIEPTRCLLPW